MCETYEYISNSLLESSYILVVQGGAIMKRKVGLVTSPAPKDTREANTERILLS